MLNRIFPEEGMKNLAIHHLENAVDIGCPLFSCNSALAVIIQKNGLHHESNSLSRHYLHLVGRNI
ncbi:hypothetical protein OUZ56_033012 [Daphnia magna]|uniref:Uncharacterized protein n=1 Tax=Daphnia magna TaxID=35525 RepID=A0ABR0BAD0_9CRUS|nr:hypothetical protein OUZ56_033012 [Daphnia magna]